MTDQAPRSDPRSAQLAANLAVVRARIAAAEAEAGRRAGEVTLVAITKNWPPADVHRIAALGVRDVGENRDQEAGPKHEACLELPLTWHFVGQLQRNKAASVARYADVVQSVDRLPLVATLAACAQRVGRILGVCLQLDLAEQVLAGRGGARVGELPQLARAVAGHDHLRLLGVMAVAPVGVPPQPAFRRLWECSTLVRELYPDADMISAGMSQDLEPAIAAGATHVRIGSALFGARRRPEVP